MTLQPKNQLERIRHAELAATRQYFPDGCRILEIGGGNGYQAAVLASWGFDVVSLDIDTGGRWTRRYFDVAKYDGKTLPVADGTVDVVFSSNVLEHIAEDALQALFTEMRRVLAPDGFAVHLVPTPVWRLWTSLAHYPWLVLRVVRGAPQNEGIVLPGVASVVRRRGLADLIKRALWPAPHGEYPGSFAELFAFRERAWRKRFEAGGFSVTHCSPTGLFYSGYTLLPWLPMAWRRSLSRLLGSACKVYILKPAISAGSNDALPSS